MKTIAIIQARMGSERLPGKVLMNIAGRSMLDCVVSRIRKCQLVDQVVVATSDASCDNQLELFCNHNGIDVVRGSEHDVLSRYVKAATAYSADTVVRITADCPLIDPIVVDKVISELHKSDNAQYSSNFYPQRLFPRGLDAEALTMPTLMQVGVTATDSRHREHVTLMIYENVSKFKTVSVSNRLDHSHLRWTVDTDADLKLVRTIYQHFTDRGVESFGYPEVMQALTENWHWCQINREVRQKAA